MCIYIFVSAVLYMYQLPMHTDTEQAIAVTPVQNQSSPLPWMSEAVQGIVHYWNTN